MSTSVFPEARPFPVNLRLAGKPVLVVGGGSVAARKVGQLLDSGADVTVVAPQIDSQLEQLPVRTERRRYVAGDVAGYALVITCTDDPEVNQRVHGDAIAEGVWVNSADDPENCEFTLSSVVRRGDLQLTISTEGRSPALAMYLRRRFELEFDDSWAVVLDVLSDVRDEARSEFGTSEVPGWHDAIDDELFTLVEAGDTEGARAHVRAHLGLERSMTETASA